MLIKDCACGEDHKEMLMIDVSPCFCRFPDDVCEHEEILVPGVCLVHKRHIPCRPCMRE